jgi:hypothetical protein
MTGKNIISKLILITALIVLFSTQLTFGASYELTVDKTTIKQGTSFNLQITISNSNSVKLVSINGIDDFENISSNTANSIQIINGQTSQSQTITYTLMPKKIGAFKLQATLSNGSQSFLTNEVTLNVVERSSTATDTNEPLFIETNLSSESVYIGEKVILTYNFFSQYNIESLQFSDDFHLGNFIINTVPNFQQRSRMVTLQGKRYLEYEIYQAILTPIASGTSEIPSNRLQANILTGGGFFSQTESKFLFSDLKKINIKPLPSKNKPANFSGIVGQVNLSSNYSKTDLDINESITLAIEISGNCNLDNISNLFDIQHPNFTTYTTENELEESVFDNKYNASKKYEIIFVPKSSGSFDLNEIEINYFDPKTASYKTLKVPKTTINVTGDSPTNINSPATNIVPQANSYIEIDTVTYSTSDENYYTYKIKKKTLNYIVFSIIGLILLIGCTIIIIKFIKIYLSKNPLLKKYYAEVSKTNDDKELFNILNNIIKIKYSISLKSISKSELSSKIDNNSIASEIYAIMSYIEKSGNLKDSQDFNLKKSITNIIKMIESN